MIKYFIFSVFITFWNNFKWNHQFIFNELKGEIFGSTYFIKYQSNKNYQHHFDSIFSVINKSVNTYNQNSLLLKWNTSLSGKEIKIDQHLKQLFIESKRFYLLSDGFFDPTVALLADLYGFGENKKLTHLSNYQVDSILQFIGLNKIKLENNRLIKIHSNIQMNFNSIAPGYTADIIGKFLESKKIFNYLIDIGGEIRARGKIKDRYWKIGIEDPTQQIYERKAIKKINLINQSIATSGNYRKFYLDYNGNKVSHIVNPKNGKADTSNLLSTTVISKNACNADGLATIGMILGLKNARDFYIKNKIPVFLIYEKNKKLKTEFIGNFKNFISE